MSGKTHPSRPPRRRSVAPLALVGLALVLAVVAVVGAVVHEQGVADRRTRESLDRATGILQLNVAAAERSMTDAAGLMAARPDISRREFDAYGAVALQGTTLHAIGFIDRVPRGRRAAFERRTGLTITRPPVPADPGAEGSGRPYLVVTHISPDPGTDEGFGVDVGADPRRLSTLRRSADGGSVAATAPVTIIGTTDRGFVLYRPVYRGGGTPRTVAARRTAVTGFIFGGYLLEPLLAPVAGAVPGTRVEVRDGDEVLTATTLERAGAAEDVDVGGRTWRVSVEQADISVELPVTVAVAGLLLVAAALVVVVTLMRRERYARRAVEAATRDLAASRQEYRTLVRDLPDVVARYDADFRCTFMSDAITVTTGRPASFYVGRTLREMGIPDEARTRWETVLRSVLDTGDAHDMHFTFPSGDGVGAFHTRFVPERGPGGEVASVLCVTRDVTEARRAEDALRESEERYRTLVSSMSDGLVVQDARGRVVGLNPAARSLLGLAPGAGAAWASWEEIPWDAVREDGSPLRWDEHPALVTLRTGEPRTGDVIGVHRPDGSLVWLSVATELLPTRDGDAGTVVTCVTDVTDRVEREREQGALHRISAAVAAETSGRGVFDLIAAEAAPLVGAEAAAVVRFDSDTEGTLIGVWAAPHITPAPHDLPVDLTVPTTVRSVRETGRAASAVVRPGEARRRAVIVRHAITGAVSTPIMVGDTLWGAISAVTTDERPLSRHAEQTLDRLGHLASLAIVSSDAREQLARLASTDHLTGLYNRRAFEDRLAQEIQRARRHDRDLSLVVIDLDHFKLVNDTHGHPAGDGVLMEVAARLMTEVRGGEVLARIGGEEFGWILPETDAAGAVAAAERVRVAIGSVPFPTVGRLSASFGVCDLEEARDATDLFRLADVALYWAKTQGRDRVFRYSRETLELLPPHQSEERLQRARALAGVRALAAAIDAKDASTQRHSERVAALARELAEACGWTPADADLLHEAALVHDVGKIAVPDAVLLKPGRLDAEELRQVREHARIGAAMLEDVLTDEQVSWVRAHHERVDGTGYPDGLAGDAIPEGASLLALADAWDAMTTARPYGAPLSADLALRECVRLSGTQFAPRAVEALVALTRTRGLATPG